MRKFRGVALLLVVLMAVSMALAGCGGPDDGNEGVKEYKEPVFDENKTYNLQFAWWGDTERENTTRAAIDLWNERYPKIQVEGISAGWDGYHDKLRIQLLTGQGGYFHIFQFSTLYLRLFAEGGRLMDLTPYADRFVDIAPTDDALWDGLKFNDEHIFALPSGIASGLIMYNKDTLDRYDIDYPTDNETNDTMDERYRELTEKARAAGNDKMWGSSDPLDSEASTYAAMIEDRGVQPWTDDYLDTNFDSEESIAIIEKIGELGKEGLVIPTDISISNSAEYLDKYSGYGGAGSTSATSSIALLKSEIGLVQGAGPGEGQVDHRVQGPGLPIAINARVEDDELLGASLKFLEWFLLSTEAAEKLGFSRGIPPSKAQQEFIKPTLNKIESDIMRINDQIVALGNEPGQRMPARIAAFDTVFQIAQDRYFFQGATIREFMVEGAKNGRVELKKGMKDQ